MQESTKRPSAIAPGSAARISRIGSERLSTRRWPELSKGRSAATAMARPGLKRAHYRESRLPLLLLLPQLLVLLLFFFIPAIRALVQAFVHHRSVRQQRPVRLVRQFPRAARRAPNTVVDLGDDLVHPDAERPHPAASRCVLAFATDRVVRGRGLYRSVILLPYAIAPVIAGILWAFLFNPVGRPVAYRAARRWASPGIPSATASTPSCW